MRDYETVTVTRRRLVSAGLVGGAVAVAGCTARTAEGPADGEPEDRSTPVDPVPEDARCAVCNMVPAKFPAWNAQLIHRGGQREHFCSPGCMVTYHVDPGHFVDGRTREGIAGVWVHGRGSGALIDGTTAFYVLDTDPERTGGPMSGNPLPYAAKDDAVAYTDEYEDLTAEDVIRLEAFTRETASQYRGRFL